MDTDGDAGIDGTYVFDHNRSRQGYALNKMCMSLTQPENREEFLADRLAYMHRFNVPDDQIAAVQSRDWLTLTRCGGNVYMLLKLGHLVGDELYALGAQQRGETLDQFLATRLESGAR
jgi:protocatechuate 4,5-dioxygenase, alpha chain